MTSASRSQSSSSLPPEEEPQILATLDGFASHEVLASSSGGSRSNSISTQPDDQGEDREEERVIWNRIRSIGRRVDAMLVRKGRGVLLQALTGRDCSPPNKRQKPSRLACLSFYSFHIIRGNIIHDNVTMACYTLHKLC